MREPQALDARVALQDTQQGAVLEVQDPDAVLLATGYDEPAVAGERDGLRLAARVHAPHLDAGLGVPQPHGPVALGGRHDPPAVRRELGVLHRCRPVHVHVEDAVVVGHPHPDGRQDGLCGDGEAGREQEQGEDVAHWAIGRW